MAWQFILTDLQGVPHGELTGAKERTVTDPWMRIPTASCTIPLWHPLADTALSTDCLLKAYRTDITGSRTLVFHGHVISGQEAGNPLSQTVNISAVGPMFKLAKRLLGASKSGFELNSLDLSNIAKGIVDAANGRGETGISTNAAHGAQLTTVGEVASTGKWWLKPASEALAEVVGGLNAAEWRVRPIEPVASGSFPRIAVIDFKPESSFRVDRTDAVYEYGTTRANVTSYERQVSRDQMLNRAIVNVQGWPDTPAVISGVAQDLITVNDAPSQTARGLLEEVVPDGGAIHSTLRTQIANQHIYFRKNPRQIITFNPAPDSRPVPYVDYFNGENIRARAVVRGVKRFDAMFRVYGLSFAIDDQGSETVSIELIEPSI
jgi:hypothetical protein